MKSLGIGEEKDRQYPEQEKYVGMENKKDRQYPEQEKYVGMENQEVWKYPIAGNGSAEVFIVKYNYPKLQSKNGQCCMSVLDNVAKYWISDS